MDHNITMDQTTMGQTTMGQELSLEDTAAATVRRLAPHEVLFRSGDRKNGVYRVESGVICLYDPRSCGGQAFVEFLFAGDLVGLGFLETHALSARAVIAATVTRLPLAEASKAVAGNLWAQAKLDQVVERELESRREDLVQAGRESPVERLASVLVNLSCSNEYEGRDPEIITDRMDTETWSELLGVDMHELTAMLLELMALDLIEPVEPSSLRLKNIPALESLADGRRPVMRRPAIARSVGARPPRLPHGAMRDIAQAA